MPISSTTTLEAPTTAPSLLTLPGPALLEVSNLGRMGALSVSSPALVAELGGGIIWNRLKKNRRNKAASSSTHLLEGRQEVAGSGETFTTQLSCPVSPEWRVEGGGWRVEGAGGTGGLLALSEAVAGKRFEQLWAHCFPENI